ncbi:16S rRNA (guanine(966)-N(2))-methyltransferase RsmD [Herbaspirillum sp. alder98]|uniref:16S rRNA (guanine(966)-N(2))-methyltransferase RsmD n=1 Tax=Herbaspirillum sp. alder98 TaxID=2913096 RepID=UPI001CD84EFC|nr:16S rRNA (guanine(966)-N(2))-methyltransferase RsmD [Herbaspirillum sp. alder98]MCA1324156.1 16S rRNA (guanine(966)-N(2))-methyltransferase RsmD [Herbaspirillum sp. alder98]
MKQAQPRKQAGKPAAARVVPHQVRIIGGQWKRTPLPVLDAEGLRPTPDRVRETVFNWLTHLFDGAWEGIDCLDLFAGSGALGFEAASRGAAHVTMVELGTAAVRQLEATRDKLRAGQVNVQRADALSAVRNLAQHRPGRFQLVFIDPPYNGGWLEKMLPLCQPLLAPQGLVYAEAEFALDGDDAPEWMADWEVLRSDKAGMVFYHLLQRKSTSRIEA